MNKLAHAAGLAAVVVIAGGLGFLSYRALQPAGLPTMPEKTDNVSNDSSFAPAFSLPDTSGKLISTTDFEGQWLLVNFWATWCPPCIEEMPLLSTLDTRYPTMAVVGVALDDADSIKAFAKKVPVVFPLLVADSSGSEIARQWGNNAGALPFTALVNPQGAVVRRWLGPLEVDRIDEELAEHLR